jgi:hypothetical protein
VMLVLCFADIDTSIDNLLLYPGCLWQLHLAGRNRRRKCSWARIGGRPTTASPCLPGGWCFFGRLACCFGLLASSARCRPCSLAWSW